MAEVPSARSAALHPLNALLRFVLELAALVAMGYGAGRLAHGALHVLAMVGLPLLAAVAWGTFTVPADPSRGKVGPRPVSGPMRLLVEGLFFALPVGLLLCTDAYVPAGLLAAAVLVHYVSSRGRVRWLWTQPDPARANRTSA